MRFSWLPISRSLFTCLMPLRLTEPLLGKIPLRLGSGGQEIGGTKAVTAGLMRWPCESR